MAKPARLQWVGVPCVHGRGLAGSHVAASPIALGTGALPPSSSVPPGSPAGSIGYSGQRGRSLMVESPDECSRNPLQV